MMIFAKRLTETLLLEKPENLETIPSNMASQRKFFINSGVLYIIKKVIKCKL